MDSKVRKTDAEWLQELGPDRFRVLRQAGTEPPFTGELLTQKADGTFVCGACGAALFASDAKYESHCGWPSFVEPADEAAVTLKPDTSHGMMRDRGALRDLRLPPRARVRRRPAGAWRSAVLHQLALPGLHARGVRGQAAGRYFWLPAYFARNSATA